MAGAQSERLIAESDAVADAGSASDEPGHNCQFCRPWQALTPPGAHARLADSGRSELPGTQSGPDAGCCSRFRGILSPRDDRSRSEGPTILFQACGKGKQRTVCAMGAQDREPEWAAIECSKGERKLWQAAEPGYAKQ